MPSDPKQQPLSFITDPKSGPVHCLGYTFGSDEERRKFFLQRLRQKLGDSNFRQTGGFPVGPDETILALSDPPYYTACPNPFFEEFLRIHGRDFTPNEDYHREPFAADVAEGKTDSIYKAHTYHTKVPHKAIMRYILHYTEPGDIVLDGFCGTGMTGVAAQLCGDKSAVEELGYLVEPDGTILDEREQRVATLGTRWSILNDLSPAASFIAYNYNVPADVPAVQEVAQRLLDQFEAIYGWMYETRHTDDRQRGRINYVVWSDVYRCPHCQGKIVFWLDATDAGKVRDEIVCPSCGAVVSKQALDRATTTVFDTALGSTIQKALRVPVLINYSVHANRYEKEPDAHDLALLRRIDEEPIPGWYPTARIDRDIDLWYERDYRSLGIYSIDSFFYKRSLIAISHFREQIFSQEGRQRGALWFWFQSVLMGMSLLNRYRPSGYSQVNQILSGTLYVGALLAEVSPWYALEGKLDRFDALEVIRRNNSYISTYSTTALDLPPNSVDYIFVDPPFGSNIIYSDLSLIWESWLGLLTNTDQEAVVHRRKKKGASTLDNYKRLMAESFREMERVLKPGRWMTVEFHNSQNSVWVAIQEGLEQAGFVVADVRTLDKKMGTFKQVTSASAVKQDLIISAYKPDMELVRQFQLTAGTEEGAWEFVRAHLRQLPVFVSRASEVQVLAERQNYVLYDRMIAFHVQRGKTVPLSASEFYAGLTQRFAERDGMYFLPDQVVEYDRRRMLTREVEQMPLLVSDEATAIQWLRQTLSRKPQTYQDIHVQFLMQLHVLNKYEELPELITLLSQNFLRYDGVDDVPNQIHAYLSTNYKDLRGLSKEDARLRSMAKGRWYVPDPNNAAQLEKLREGRLLREFETYLESKQGQLRSFRLEAVRAGFRKAWQERDYDTILWVARKIPEKVLQEDPKLLMWYDQAMTRKGAQVE